MKILKLSKTYIIAKTSASMPTYVSFFFILSTGIFVKGGNFITIVLIFLIRLISSWLKYFYSFFPILLNNGPSILLKSFIYGLA